MKNKIISFKIPKDFIDLPKIYNQIWAKGKEAISQNKISIDQNLLDLKNDKRRGLTILFKIKNSEKINAVLNKLKEIEPDQYYYPDSDFHLTILPVITCQKKEYSPEQISAYRKVFTQLGKTFQPFTVNIKGVAGTDDAVIAKGFAQDQMQTLRADLKKICQENNLELHNYTNPIIHSTIVRFKAPLKNPEKFAQILEELKDVDLGEHPISEIHFVKHDWYNRKENVEDLDVLKIAPKTSQIT